MGTLVTENKANKKKSQKPRKDDIIVPESKERKKLNKRIEKEYARMRFQMEEIRQTFAYLEAAQPYDDVSGRLLELEKAVKHVRKGGFFGRGAKTHRSLLRKLKKMPLE